MKRQLQGFLLAAVMALAACSSLPRMGCDSAPGASSSTPAVDAAHGVQSARTPSETVMVEDRDGRVEVQKVEFRPGVSSTTVERLAKRHGCVGSTGAGLLTAKGPVEVYRMACENGTVFMARCELRQCRPMR